MNRLLIVLALIGALWIVGCSGGDAKSDAGATSAGDAGASGNNAAESK